MTPKMFQRVPPLHPWRGGQGVRCLRSHSTRSVRSVPLAALAILLGLLSSAPLARANGFYIQEMSAAGMAQGGALVAAGERPSAIYQNAANLAYIPGLMVEASLSTYIPVGSYTNPAGATTELEFLPVMVPHVFASWRINDWLAVGLAEFTDYGLSMAWPEDWEGRHMAIESGMQTFTINPNVAFGPFAGFTVAVGFDAKYGSFAIKRGLTLGEKPPGEEDVPNTLEVAGDAWGFGANVGLMYQPADWVRIGLAYRSTVKVAAEDGTADFDVTSPYAPLFPDQHFSATIDLPHVIFGGARFWIMDNLSVELDLQWVQWSSYDKLRFEFSEGLVTGPNSRQMVMEELKDYTDAIQIRLGGQYTFYDDHLAARLGFLWDQNPAPDHTVDPTLPDTERVMPCFGLGATWAGFYADLAYMPVIALEREIKPESGNPFPGSYRAVTHDIVLTLGYQFL